jgi:hypothetical protein
MLTSGTGSDSSASNFMFGSTLTNVLWNTSYSSLSSTGSNFVAVGTVGSGTILNFFQVPLLYSATAGNVDLRGGLSNSAQVKMESVTSTSAGKIVAVGGVRSLGSVVLSHSLATVTAVGGEASAILITATGGDALTTAYRWSSARFTAVSGVTLSAALISCAGASLNDASMTLLSPTASVAIGRGQYTDHNECCRGKDDRLDGIHGKQWGRDEQRASFHSVSFEFGGAQSFPNVVDHDGHVHPLGVCDCDHCLCRSCTRIDVGVHVPY